MTIHPHDDFELMSLRRLNDSLEATRTMLRQVQRIAHNTQAVLIDLATEFSGQALRQLQESNDDLFQVPAEELASLLRSRFKSLALANASEGLAGLAESNRIIEELHAEVETQRNRADLAREKIVQLERQIQILEGTLENDHQTHPKEPNPAPPVISEETADYHTWYSVWHGENHSLERDCDLINFIGQSGLSLSTEIEETMAKNKGRSSRTIRRALLECLQAGLLEQASTASIEGRPALRYTLSNKGKWLFRELAGAEAKSPDFLELLKVHKSERHLAVIQKSAEEFTRLGYRVSQEPVRLQVEENRYFEPDLVIRKGEETYYLEVETGEKAKPSLPQKWENAAAAGGRICVVTDNLATLRRIQGNIAQGSILEGRRINLFITSLVTLKEKKPWESPWYALKEYSPG